MKRNVIIGAVIILVVAAFIFYNNFNNSEEYNWQDDGIELMQHETDGFYACFGCNSPSGGRAMCIDPAPVMILVEETEERYCNNDFEVIENGK